MRKFLGDRVVWVTSNPITARYGESAIQVTVALQPSTASSVPDILYSAVQSNLAYHQPLPVYVSYTVEEEANDSRSD